MARNRGIRMHYSTHPRRTRCGRSLNFSDIMVTSDRDKVTCEVCTTLVKADTAREEAAEAKAAEAMGQ